MKIYCLPIIFVSKDIKYNLTKFMIGYVEELKEHLKS